MNNSTLQFAKDISLIESFQSNVSMYQQDGTTTVITTIGLSTAAMIIFVTRGTLIYYIKCEAPRDRPINKMMLWDQVSKFNTIILQKINLRVSFLDHSICLHFELALHWNSVSSNSNTILRILW